MRHDFMMVLSAGFFVTATAAASTSITAPAPVTFEGAVAAAPSAEGSVVTRSYPRLTKKTRLDYEAITGAMGFAGDLSDLYIEKIITAFDLFSARKPMKLRLNKKATATVRTEEEFRSRAIKFEVKEPVWGDREIIVREKSLLEQMAEHNPETAELLRKNPRMGRQGRVEGMGAIEALIAYARAVSKGDEAKLQLLTDLEAEFNKAYDQMYVDYMMLKGLPKVVTELEEFMATKLETDDLPSEAVMKSIRRKFKGAEDVKAWVIGDQDYVVTLATIAGKKLLEIDDEQGVITRIDLSTFDPKAPAFLFVVKNKVTVLRVTGDSFKWEGEPQGEELRIVFALELMSQRMKER